MITSKSINRLILEYILLLIGCYLLIFALIKLNLQYLNLLTFALIYFSLPVLSLIYASKITKKINSKQKFLVSVIVFVLLFGIPGLILSMFNWLPYGF